MWEPKHKMAAMRKARKVALFIRGYYNRWGHDPTLKAIALEFNRSLTWARNYKRLAFKYDYLETRKEYQ